MPHFTLFNVFQGCFGLYGLLLFIYYVTHLETDPLTKRSRFIIFNKEQEKKLGKMVLETVSKFIECLKKNLNTLELQNYGYLKLFFEFILSIYIIYYIIQYSLYFSI
jgi:hypothetical protein